MTGPGQELVTVESGPRRRRGGKGKEKPTGVAGRLLAGSPVMRSGRCETTPLSHRRHSRIIAAGYLVVEVRLASERTAVKGVGTKKLSLTIAVRALTVCKVGPVQYYPKQQKPLPSDSSAAPARSERTAMQLKELREAGNRARL